MSELQQFSSTIPHPDVIHARLAELAGERHFLRKLLRLAEAAQAAGVNKPTRPGRAGKASPAQAVGEALHVR